MRLKQCKDHGERGGRIMYSQIFFKWAKERGKGLSLGDSKVQGQVDLEKDGFFILN